MEKRQGDEMSARDVEGEWRAASYFLAKGPSAKLQYLQTEVRSQLFALKAQALDGDCPPGQDGSLAMDPSLRIRQVSRFPPSHACNRVRPALMLVWMS